MTTPPIELIKQLREESGAGVLHCRTALEEANQDYDKALASLREKALVTAAKHADRPATQGMLELYSHNNGRIGVIVEVNTESDFAARSAAFRTFVHEISLQIAAAAPGFVSDEAIPEAVLQEEAQAAADKARLAGKAEVLIPRIVEGQLKKFKDQQVLLRQVYIRNESLTVAQLLGQAMASVGENIIIRRFVRWELGEEAERE